MLRLFICFVLLSAHFAAAAEWETSNPSLNGYALSASAAEFGGRFTRSTAFHYAADTAIGGRVRRLDRISASGMLRIAPRAGFDAGVHLGHFEKEGGHLAYTDFVGIRLLEYSSAAMRVQAFISFNRGALRAGPALILPAGEYAWSYEWDPAGGANGLGLLVARVGESVSELHLGADTGSLFFACNAFGLSAGYQPTLNSNYADIVATATSYTTVPKPTAIGPRTRVFLYIGQSNARGDDPDVRALGDLLEPQPDVLLWDGREWLRGQAPTEALNKYGAELSLGRELAGILREPVAIVKVTRGGPSMEAEWLPELGLSYARLLGATRAALAALDRPILSGLFSMQGESDSGQEGTSARFGENLRRIHAALEHDLGAPLPLVVTRLQNWIATPHAAGVRAGQETFVWVNTDDLPNMPDFLHFTGAGLVEIGKRLAAKYADSAAPAFWLQGAEAGLLTIPGRSYGLDVTSDFAAWERIHLPADAAFTALPRPGGAAFYRFASAE